jgi:hypothetical protein
LVTSATISKFWPTKRHVQIALGLLWLLDAGLQYQHQMFTSALANDVIAPAGQGQPSIVSGPISLAVRIVLTHPAVFNALFVTIQLIIALLILNRRTVRAGLIGSVVWGLIVWYGGEGLGGLLGWQTSLLMGAPGAALLYVIISLAVMPGRRDKPAYWLPLAWAGIWILGAVLQLLPGQNTTTDLSSMIVGMGDGAPGWLASLQIHVAQWLSTRNFQFIVLLGGLQALIGLLVLFRGRLRYLAVGVGAVLSVGFWFVGQALGTYYSGLATDPNSGPLFVLLGVAILGCEQLDFKRLHHQVAHDLTELLT